MESNRYLCKSFALRISLLHNFLKPLTIHVAQTIENCPIIYGTSVFNMKTGLLLRLRCLASNLMLWILHRLLRSMGVS